ncbi:hydrogenase expression/formation protein HypD [Gillisia sp. Hel_I_86]|uniref:hydrogenase formation protein HypD n=1 Tax=Gillisia sp. Hel_I_86 TaxID=1249981 RepID=UPI000EBB69A2|nr:hydrogenase formation protein HypD [Gillisia sp. Hel_I_86]TVZ27060.1 hydrogenase expression/formation protein HypD [Gillisia sp. Hel_I_86]HCO84239.1 hydrogenase formation protein HypD [Arenibacter sp.]
MKYMSEYRDPEVAKAYLEEIKKTVTQPWSIMEVCGGQTHSLVKNGIIDMLPKEVTMIHGPGCPVCVTPLNIIDKAIHLALEENVILCSFGDMLRVPGSKKNLLEAKAEGADIRILYSPLEAVRIAEDNPDKEIVFFAVGFETTAPANALSVIHAHRKELKNYSILASHVLVPPAIKAVIDDEESKIDGFLAAGHVCTIMGNAEYHPLSATYKVPIVVTGFEPLDVLQGILMVLKQLEGSKAQVENQYSRIVKEEGNPEAQKMIHKVFEIKNQIWRGIGEIPESGYQVRPEYADFDANRKFKIEIPEAPENPDCISGQIMKGLKKPFECSQFGKKCKPTNPLGAPMVSSEGACAAYYHFSGLVEA